MSDKQADTQEAQRLIGQLLRIVPTERPVCVIEAVKGRV